MTDSNCRVQTGYQNSMPKTQTMASGEFKISHFPGRQGRLLPRTPPPPPPAIKHDYVLACVTTIITRHNYRSRPRVEDTPLPSEKFVSICASGEPWW